jgi:hypothetical protein
MAWERGGRGAYFKLFVFTGWILYIACITCGFSSHHDVIMSSSFEKTFFGMIIVAPVNDATTVRLGVAETSQPTRMR